MPDDGVSQRGMSHRPGAATWTQNADAWELRCGLLSARVIPNQPTEGLSDVGFTGARLAGRLLGVDPSMGALGACVEAYARGVDLISAYAGDDDHPFRTRLRWSARSLNADAGAAITLEVSLQTDLLDARPELVVASAVEGLVPSEASDAHASFASDDATVVLAPHPSDLAETRSRVEAGAYELILAPPFLEKGVIRRCRVAALLLPGRASGEAIRAAIDDFADEPLPLTA